MFPDAPSDNPGGCTSLPAARARPPAGLRRNGSISDQPAGFQRPESAGRLNPCPNPACASPEPSEFQLTLLISTSREASSRLSSAPTSIALPLILSPI